MPQFLVRVDLPLNPRAPSAARAVVDAALPLWELGHVVDDVKLIVSELVSNVVLHASKSESMRLEVETRPGRLHVALADGSAVQPVIRELASDETSGRGLRLVEALASRWGSTRHETGKRIWLEIDVEDE